MAEAKDDWSAGDEVTAAQINTHGANINNAGGFRDTYNAGETINGATLPVAVYRLSADSEIYACDPDDTTELNFLGFAISNSTNGNPISIQTEGIVTGFSGLTIGSKYYVQSNQTLGTTVTPIQVGYAISTTEILISSKSLSKNCKKLVKDVCDTLSFPSFLKAHTMTPNTTVPIEDTMAITFTTESKSIPILSQ